MWHELDGQNGCSAEQYERNCRMLYTEVLARIFVLEPFAAKGTVYEGERWTSFRRAVEQNAAAARKLADELGLIFVPLQQRIDAHAALLGVEAVTREGVHPTDVGYSLIAAALAEKFEEEIAR